MRWGRLELTQERTQTFMDEFEQDLKDITIAYLLDRDINRYQGVRAWSH